MLEGFVPFPSDFAARYRAKGYWQDRSLAQEFADVFQRYADRIALIDGDTVYTYAELDRVSSNLALNLLELGLRPLAVHMDNGWNSELAQNNIANLVQGLGVDPKFEFLVVLMGL